MGLQQFHPPSVSPLPVSVRYRHFKYRCTMHYLGKPVFISLLQEWKQQRRKLVFRFFFPPDCKCQQDKWSEAEKTIIINPAPRLHFNGIFFLFFHRSLLRWFCHVDDDNYVNPEALLSLLSAFPQEGDIYVGKPSLDKPITAHELLEGNATVRYHS